MWRSPLPKGILGDPHLDHMMVSIAPSNRDLHRSESVRPVKLNTRSSVVLASGITRNWRVMTEMRGNRACPTSLHQTRKSTSWVMSDPSLFLSITALLWITGMCNISILVLSTEICGDMFAVDNTVWAGDTILHKRRHTKLKCERSMRKERAESMSCSLWLLSRDLGHVTSLLDTQFCCVTHRGT